MFETVTVEEALNKGRKMITYPVMFIIFASFLAWAIYCLLNEAKGWWIATGVIAGLFLAWLYWSIVITKWRIWAFDNVRNVHELKKLAIKEGLIWQDGSFFEDTEIRSAADREKLKSLESKFSQPDVFIDDYLVPAETQIYYSKSKSLLSGLWTLAMLIVGIYFIVEHNYLLGIILSIAGAGASYSYIKEAANKQPQIILNQKGIQTSSTPFYEWKDISNEDVIAEHRYKDSDAYYLVYDYPEDKEKKDLDDLDINRHALENLLRVYRGRNTAH
jgi:hypothetical protein